MFTALVLICNIDRVNPNECATSVSTMFYPSEAECIARVEENMIAGTWFKRDEESGITYNAIEYRCFEWKSGSNV